MSHYYVKTTFKSLFSCPLLAGFLIFISGTEFVFAQHAVSTVCGSTPGNPLSGPAGLTVSVSTGEIFLADYSSHTIMNINPQTGAATVFAGNGNMGHADGALLTSQFNYPSGVSFTSNGQALFVADNANCVIRKIDLTTQTVSTVAGELNAYDFADSSNGMFAKFNQPLDLVIAPGDSVIYISDSENHAIRKFNTLTGAVTTIAGTGSAGSNNGSALTSTFRNPNGIALSADGSRLYIADAGNHLIRMLDIDSSIVSTVAGIAGMAGNNDSTGTLASFNTPTDIALSGNDSILYVTDMFNNVIRMIELTSNIVSTVAGGNSTSANHFADDPSGLNALFWRPISCAMSTDNSVVYISDQENFRVRRRDTDLIVWISDIDGKLPGVYPNPAQDFLNVKSENGIASIRIGTMDGKIVYGENFNSTEIKTQIGHFKPGLYVIEITDASGNRTVQRLMKQ